MVMAYPRPNGEIHAVLKVEMVSQDPKILYKGCPRELKRNVFSLARSVKVYIDSYLQRIPLLLRSSYVMVFLALQKWNLGLPQQVLSSRHGSIFNSPGGRF